MNELNAAVFNSHLMLVRALDLHDNEVWGYYRANGKHYVFDIYAEIPHDVEVNPYTICRNSGIKDKNGSYVFEYDLLKCSMAMRDTEYGFLYWSGFDKAWKIKRSLEYGGNCDVNKFTIEMVGNIVLHDCDAEKIYKQDEQFKNSPTVIDNSYCPSKYKK